MSELMDLFTHLGEQLSRLFGLFGMLTNRFTTNLSASFTMMDAKQWIRLVIIVGAYALARPYIIKLGAKAQAKQFEKLGEEDAAQAKISPNELRGSAGLDDDADDDEAEATGAAAASNWGKKARKRQRNMIKKILEDEERRLQELQEDDEDQDIAQYLVG